MKKIQLGISSCLLGQEVRYDGGHKRNRYVVNTLSEYFDFVPVCPELGIGLGVPREPIQLRGPSGAVRVVGVNDASLDVTDKLREYGRTKARQLTDICGYILKAGSPSCGMERVKRYTKENSMPQRDGVGQYAAALIEENPLLPVEEEGRLNDPMLRENFVERIFVYYRWQRLLADGASMQALTEFHARHKYALMAHSQQNGRALGVLLANADSRPLDDVVERYGRGLMQCFSKLASRKGNTNVLQHVQGYLKNKLSSDDKQELVETIERYRLGQVPLVVPMTLLGHHFRKHPEPYIRQQTYMSPHPPELMLRNLV